MKKRQKIIGIIAKLVARLARMGSAIDKKLHIHILAPVVLSALLLAIWFVFIRGHEVAVLHPQGTIASQQRSLLFVATVLMLIVVVPVFVLTAVITWRYRDGNKKARYTPDWDHHTELEFIWWALPCLIILALAFLAWHSSHNLDPYRAINNGKQPVTVQVIALQWKWLFVYPDQHVASVNYLPFPEDTPLNLQITADAPMNSFWVPELGGQVYAMSGMTTKLHLAADHTGIYHGVSANLSGDGFAGMRFNAQAVSADDFAAWVTTTQHSQNTLGEDEYARLAKPSTNNTPAAFHLTDPALYDKILMKYMGPLPHSDDDHDGD